MREAVDAREAIQSLIETIWRLRQPGGCPWDRKQTHVSIAGNMVEEAYEALDAIERDDTEHLREELGDVLMQVLMQAQIAADADEFTFQDVARDVEAKLIRRHPHVFANDVADDVADVSALWDRVKLQERSDFSERHGRGGSSGESLLDSVPRALPALRQAQNVSRKAAAIGLDLDDREAVWDRMDRDRAAFRADPPDSPERESELGDLLFSLVNIARIADIDAERALRASTSAFRRRWQTVERLAGETGANAEHLSASELNMLWDQAGREGSTMERSANR
ncbi:MazG family protein [Coriobacterium glomerans PW2]|uniref:MazG family protein n=1 Tax=Coriobacterium glomerans (strain ATCC 49209 / DSM 20642 / JCM 10262 / PW2) TaxID=700015 RepID=F2N704_CORGP|nr:nucleoside triphosphate pyrophosphohydrolase [Coriobacterium glomerans]AEB06343.1 MazG family protein [Coriobacterium glomerans PW2]